MPTYFTLLTPAGLAKVANAQLTNEKIEISQVAVGDGNGSAYQPLGTESTLKREVWRGGIASIEIDSQNPNWIVVEGVIPASAGGFTIREVGLFDTDGVMIAIGNYPDTYKPVIADGSTMDLALRTIIEVNNASSVTLRVDPNVIVASRAYVDGKLAGVTTHLADYEYQVPTIVGSQLQLTKRSNTKRLFIKLDNPLSGQITVSLNAGATSRPLRDIDGQQVTQIDKGYAEVIEDTSFFTLRSQGISSADLQALIAIVNEAERNESTLKTQLAQAINDVDTDGEINLPAGATWAEILAQVPNIKNGRKWAEGSATVSTGKLTVTGLSFSPTIVIVVTDRNDQSFFSILLPSEFANNQARNLYGEYYAKTQIQRTNFNIDTGLVIGQNNFTVSLPSNDNTNITHNWIAFE